MRVLVMSSLVLSLGASLFADGFTQTNLVSDIPGMAKTLDPNLQDPWGMSFSAGSPIWVSDRASGEQQVRFRSTAHRQIPMIEEDIALNPEVVDVAAGIRVDQNLITVEAVSRGRIEWPIHPVCVKSARAQPAHENMPEVESLVDVWIEANRLVGLFGIRRFEQ